jgi:DNA ligase-1
MGTVIRLKYQELTDGGVPRFPVYAGLRTDSLLTLASPIKGNKSMSTSQASTMPSKRRFEFVEGKCKKFWEISVHGTDVSILFGRIGTSGQHCIKEFPTATDADKHAEKLIHQKIGKGYVEAA